MSFRFSVNIALWLLGVGTAAAQESIQYGSISGHVEDASGLRSCDAGRGAEARRADAQEQRGHRDGNAARRTRAAGGRARCHVLPPRPLGLGAMRPLPP